jgi:cysteine desulfurase
MIAALRRLEAARAVVVGTIGAQPEEVVFTGGASEANALAVLGLAAV